MNLIKYIDSQIQEWTEVYHKPDLKKYRGEVMARLDTLRDIKRKAEELKAENEQA